MKKYIFIATGLLLCVVAIFVICYLSDIKKHNSPEKTINEFVESYIKQDASGLFSCLSRDYVFEFYPNTWTKVKMQIDYMQLKDLIDPFFYEINDIDFKYSSLEKISDNNYQIRYKIKTTLSAMKQIPNGTFNSEGRFIIEFKKNGKKYVINKLIEQLDPVAKPGFSAASFGFLHTWQFGIFYLDSETKATTENTIKKYEIYLESDERTPYKELTERQKAIEMMKITYSDKKTNKNIFSRVFIYYEKYTSTELYFDAQDNRIENISIYN